MLASSVLTIAQADTPQDTGYVHSPRKATLLSAVLPGAGQVYNKKYWKLPIIYGGLGTAIYFIDRNNGDIRFLRDQIIAIQDDDPLTVNETSLGVSELQTVLDQRKNWRDWSYVATLLVYTLQILDANVDAHLYYFDVSDDLSLSVLPYMDSSVAPSAGLHLSLHF